MGGSDVSGLVVGSEVVGSDVFGMDVGTEVVEVRM